MVDAYGVYAEAMMPKMASKLGGKLDTWPVKQLPMNSHKKRTNRFHAFALITCMLSLMLLLGYITVGTKGLAIMGAIGLLLLVVTPKIPSAFIMRLIKAKPLSEREAPGLYQAIQSVSERAGLGQVPQLYFINVKEPNAFTAGTKNNPAIAVTTGLLYSLNLREVTGVVAHEIGHIYNHDLYLKSITHLIGRMTSLFSTLGQLMLLVYLPLFLFGNIGVPWKLILLLLAAPVVHELLEQAFSRRREFQADLQAAQLTGDPAGLANALHKLDYQNNTLLRILVPGQYIPQRSLFDSHPDTNERVRRLTALAEENPLPLAGNRA